MKAKSSRSASSSRPGETQASACRGRPSCQEDPEEKEPESRSSSPLAYSSPEDSPTPPTPTSTAAEDTGEGMMFGTAGEACLAAPMDSSHGEHAAGGMNLSTQRGSGVSNERGRRDCVLRTSTGGGGPEEEEATMLIGRKAAEEGWGKSDGGSSSSSKGGCPAEVGVAAVAVATPLGLGGVGARMRLAAARRRTQSFILHWLLRCPEARQRRQRTGSRQLSTKWSVARQR
jgi:hypothetical protein